MFENDTVSSIVDDFRNMSEQLRKKYCSLYSAQISNHLRRYFRKLASIDIYSEDDPADIHPEIFAVAKLLLETNTNQNRRKKPAE
jgi:hypothetical protein